MSEDRLEIELEKFTNSIAYRLLNEKTKALFQVYIFTKRPAVIFGDLEGWTDEEISFAIKKLMEDFIYDNNLTKEDCFD